MNSSEELYPYVIPEIDGVEEVLSYHFRNGRVLSSDYSYHTHYVNKLFDKYDFVAREQFTTAYNHLKLVILNEERNSILHIPKRDDYEEIFKDFRFIPGSISSGVDVSLSSKVMTKIIGNELCIQNKPIYFNLYFYPDNNSEIRTSYTRNEILSDKVRRLEKEIYQIKKDMSMKFEIMKNDLEMRLSVLNGAGNGKV